MDDRVKAEALRIASERLKALGWKYNAKDIGEYAAEILTSLDNARKSPK